MKVQCQVCKSIVNDMLVWVEDKPVCYACYIAHKNEGQIPLKGEMTWTTLPKSSTDAG